jgi:hypothetical protein
MTWSLLPADDGDIILLRDRKAVALIIADEATAGEIVEALDAREAEIEALT